MFESKMRRIESDLLKTRNILETLHSGYLNDAGMLHYKSLLLRQLHRLECAVADAETALDNEITDLTDGGEGEAEDGTDEE